MDVTFYLPEAEAGVPATIDEFWAWQTTRTDLSPWWGRYHWVLQSYLRLNAAGYPCRISHRLPDEGIVISHRDCFPSNLHPSRRQLLVSLQVDRSAGHPYAQVQVVHRPGQTMDSRRLSFYLPPWPQVSLLPREESRAERFENVAFVGYANNLDPVFRSTEFAGALSQLGLRLIEPGPAHWHDFREVDAVLAIRHLGRVDVGHKSAIKLVNAWTAGVPEVLGFELGYREARRSPLDYLEATTPAEALYALRRLAWDPELRWRMVQNGRERAAAYAPDVLTHRWASFIDEVCRPMWERWCEERRFRLACRFESETVRVSRGLLRRAAVLT